VGKGKALPKGEGGTLSTNGGFFKLGELPQNPVLSRLLLLFTSFLLFYFLRFSQNH
jgi:hypothetical protein